jgi:hypothetical protein
MGMARSSRLGVAIALAALLVLFLALWGYDYRTGGSPAVSLAMATVKVFLGVLLLTILACSHPLSGNPDRSRSKPQEPE